MAFECGNAEEEHLEFDHDNSENSKANGASNKTAGRYQTELNFKAKIYRNVINNLGVFDGTISLVDSSGQSIDDAIAGLIQPDHFYRDNDDYAEDSWENTHERLEIFLGTEISDGDKLILDANQHWDFPLELPLHLNSFTETDHDSDDAFQLGFAVRQDWRLNVAGNEEQEGWLDLDTNRVVLLGVDHEIANEDQRLQLDLMCFLIHIRSHHPYRVEELMINEASDTTSLN